MTRSCILLRFLLVVLQSILLSRFPNAEVVSNVTTTTAKSAAAATFAAVATVAVAATVAAKDAATSELGTSEVRLWA